MNKKFFAALSALATMAALVLVPAPANAASISGQGTWETNLEGRDLDHDPSNGYEAYYDKALDITWLADANYAFTSGYTRAENGGAQSGTVYGSQAMWTNGRRGWGAAKDWVAGLDVHGVTDWRLPSMVDVGDDGCAAFTLTGGAGTDCLYNVDTSLSELAHMFYVTLGNSAPTAPGTGIRLSNWGLVNSGPFQNVKDYIYWVDMKQAPQINGGWGLDFYDGGQYSGYGESIVYSWAVHTGDVTAVPEPQSAALALVGFLALPLLVRRRLL